MGALNLFSAHTLEDLTIERRKNFRALKVPFDVDKLCDLAVAWHHNGRRRRVREYQWVQLKLFIQSCVEYGRTQVPKDVEAQLAKKDEEITILKKAISRACVAPGRDVSDFYWQQKQAIGSASEAFEMFGEHRSGCDAVAKSRKLRYGGCTCGLQRAIVALNKMRETI